MASSRSDRSRCVLGLALALCAAGCGDERCGTRISFRDMVTNAAPMEHLAVTTSGCSTCTHSTLQIVWQAPRDGTTGTIDVELQPLCGVRTTTLSTAATNGIGDFSYDWNTKNCGDQVDTYVFVTNSSNQQLSTFDLRVDCTQYEPIPSS